MLTQNTILALADKVLGALIATSGEEMFTWDEALEGEALGSKKNNDHLTMDLWEWPQGVALYGMFKFYKETGNEKYLQYLMQWFDKKLEEGLPEKNINTMAPFLTLAHLYQIEPKPLYLEKCKEWADWVLDEMPKTQEGGLQHVTTHTVNDQEIWDDTLFMTVLFIGKMAEVTGEDKYKQEAIKQFLLHIKYLADQKTGLWFHGWCFNGRHHFGEVFWARGNSWFTAGSVEFVGLLELPESVKQHIIDAFVVQGEKLLELQATSGLWHTVLDDPTSYVEASGSAAIAYGLLRGLREGYMGEEHKEKIEKAVEGIIGQIDEEGIVDNVSYGTAMGMDVAHYKHIPLCPTAYGQALTLLMLAECYKHIEA